VHVLLNYVLYLFLFDQKIVISFYSYLHKETQIIYFSSCLLSSSLNKGMGLQSWRELDSSTFGLHSHAVLLYYSGCARLCLMMWRDIIGTYFLLRFNHITNLYRKICRTQNIFLKFKNRKFRALKVTETIVLNCNEHLCWWKIQIQLMCLQVV
jgi:hypothetical protein